MGVAFLPGYPVSAMFFSNLLHRRVREYPKTDEDTTVILCAHNEEKSIAGTIQALLCQNYGGRICILAVDNAFTDGTKARIQAMARLAPQNRPVRYLYCGQPGKANALNLGLSRVRIRHFLTVDADTWLEKNAVQRIMNHITAARLGCVAGNLFVQKKPPAGRQRAFAGLRKTLTVRCTRGRCGQPHGRCCRPAGCWWPGCGPGCIPQCGPAGRG